MQFSEAERLRRAKLRETKSPEQVAQRRKITRIKTAVNLRRRRRRAGGDVAYSHNSVHVGKSEYAHVNLTYEYYILWFLVTGGGGGGGHGRDVFSK